MAYLHTSKLLSAVTLFAAFAGLPGEAEACSPDPCWFDVTWIDRIEPVNHAAIPSDGVLVLAATAGSQLPVADLAARLSLTVMLDGEPVLGAVEDTVVPGVIVWRPDQPLNEGTSYAVTGEFLNDAGAVEAGCGVAALPLEFDFAAISPSEPLAAPEVVAEASVEIVESSDLADLVCCDGAYPYANDCGGDQTDWGVGACAAARGRGFLHLDIKAVSPIDPASAAMLATVIRVDGEEVARGLAPAFAARRDGPACVVVEQIHLDSGFSVVTEEQCVGDELVAELGERELDPALVLDAQCEGPMYVCESSAEGGQWDPEQCTELADPEPPVESEGPPTSESEGSESAGSGSAGSESEGSESSDGGPDAEGEQQGCACASTDADPALLLGLLVVPALLRRRRR
jgi:MYXO-CTERM domain-containing protein